MTKILLIVAVFNADGIVSRFEKTTFPDFRSCIVVREQLVKAWPIEATHRPLIYCVEAAAAPTADVIP
jgi:hypothetical protein